jgi:hypothetical protein
MSNTRNKVKQVCSGGYGQLPPLAFREAMATAVHEAVTSLTSSDGVGYAVLYAYVGALLASRNTGRIYLPFTGSLRLRVGKDGASWMIDARDGGFARQEYHCWFACTYPDHRIEVVDLAARHYKTMLERFRALGPHPKPTWSLPEPPQYLWAFHTELPDWVQFVILGETMEALARALEPLGKVILNLVDFAHARLQELAVD